MVDLYNDPHVRDALVSRDGTALNKLFINPPVRYCEDIDFVQKRADPIGLLYGLYESHDCDAKRKIVQSSYESVNKIPAKIKIEINTTEPFR